MLPAHQHRHLRAQRFRCHRGCLARLPEVEICPLGPEVIWDLYRTRRVQTPARELNGDRVAIPKLGGRVLVPRTMCRQVVECVMQQRFVIRTNLRSVKGPAVRIRPPHAHQAVRPVVVHGPFDRRRDRRIYDVLTYRLFVLSAGALGRGPVACGLLLRR